MSNTEIDLSAAVAEVRARLIPALRGHGAHMSFDDAIADFPAELRNRKPPNTPYSFWHQLEHIRIAQWDLLRYATDPDHSSPAWPSDYWPGSEEKADERAWCATIAGYREDLEGLVALVSDKTVNLLAPVEHMDGRSIMRACLLVVDHTAYHIGEFVMAEQILGHFRSALA